MYLTYPTIKLKNRLVVANFSSPHDFNFDDSSVLKACDYERTAWLALDKIEDTIYQGRFYKISQEYILTEYIINEIERMEAKDDIDIILVPSIVRKLFYKKHKSDKVFSCKASNRFSKVISSNEFIWKDEL